jgi:hypothetical protein
MSDYKEILECKHKILHYPLCESEILLRRRLFPSDAGVVRTCLSDFRKAESRQWLAPLSGVKFRLITTRQLTRHQLSDKVLAYTISSTSNVNSRDAVTFANRASVASRLKAEHGMVSVQAMRPGRLAAMGVCLRLARWHLALSFPLEMGPGGHSRAAPFYGYGLYGAYYYGYGRPGI